MIELWEVIGWILISFIIGYCLGLRHHKLKKIKK